MFKTSIGSFDGDSWEDLCQSVFKKKYSAEGYQQIHASPGDFGLEGVTLGTGCGFQCYCPDKHYSSKELYEAQRDKITRDLGKLRLYEGEIAKRIFGTLIKTWIFVTPEIGSNVLLSHARSKEAEVRKWGLSILDPDFRILLYDADHFLTEINDVLAAAGSALALDDSVPGLAPLAGPPDVYEQNVLRKTELRLAPKASSTNYLELLDRLNRRTLESFLGADALFRHIEATAPTLYFRLARLINEYENYVVDTATVWVGTAEELTLHVSSGLAQRISAELAPEVDITMANKIARHMAARWLAVCQLDYE